MATRYAALLRGVNVGGRNKVAMPALRATVEGLGFTDVATLIQSGNVVFTAPGKVTATALEAVIRDELEVDVAVMLRTHRELDAIMAADPFPKADRSRVHVAFLYDKPPAGALAALDLAPFAPDEVVLHGRELYYHLPNGMGRTKLPPFVDRRLKVPATARSWSTLTKLHQLTS